MIRKLKRTENYELSLQLKNDQFIAPPREAQRNALLNRAMTEFARDLDALDERARNFVAGADTLMLGDDRAQSDLADDDIMEDWQVPLMKAMAREATRNHGDVLEIGFGRGVSANFIQDFGVRSHTIVECNLAIAKRFEAWRAARPDSDIRFLLGLWQDVQNEFAEYDGIFFHTYPLNDDEYAANVANSVTFAAHFFPTAARHLRQGGALTYMTNEMDSLSRAHQRELLRHFRSYECSLVALSPPQNVRDVWYADSMIVVRAVK